MKPESTAAKPSRREIRRRVDQLLAKLEPKDRGPRPGSPAGVAMKHAAATREEPKSGLLSHEKPASRKEAQYQPHLAKGAKFLDTRGRRVEVSERGELRATGKKQSRVKRLRAEQAAKGES